MQLGAEFNLFLRISAGREAGESGRPGRFETARGRVGAALRRGAWHFGDAGLMSWKLEGLGVYNTVRDSGGIIAYRKCQYTPQLTEAEYVTFIPRFLNL